MLELMEYLFSEAGTEDVLSASGYFDYFEADYDTVLIRQGDDASGMLILVDGDAEIIHDGLRLARLYSGAMAGELCLFGKKARTATVVATTPVKVLSLDQPGFRELQRSGNLVAWILEVRALATVVRRLRDTQLRIARLADQRQVNQVVPEPGFMGWFRGNLSFWGRSVGGASRRKKLLRSLPPFSQVSESALRELAAAMGSRRYREGEFICVAGDEASQMYLLVDGQVDVRASGTSEFVATLPPGEFFGVSSMLENLPRNASCVARSKEVTVLTLGKIEWRKFAEETSRAASSLRSAMILALAHQLERANMYLGDLTLREGDVPDSLPPLRIGSLFEG